jgi:hypothetical protein
MNPIRDATVERVQVRHEEGNEARGAELSQEKPRIPVSQIGHCPRMAIFEAARYHPDHPLHVAPTHLFDDYVLEIMEAGDVWERQTTRALARKYGDAVHWKKDDDARRVKDDCWSGHVDFLVEPCGSFPVGAVIEHKATNPANFQRQGRLNYPFHCLQVLTRERLLRQKMGRRSTTAGPSQRRPARGRTARKPAPASATRRG